MSALHRTECIAEVKRTQDQAVLDAVDPDKAGQLNTGPVPFADFRVVAGSDGSETCGRCEYTMAPLEATAREAEAADESDGGGVQVTCPKCGYGLYETFV